MSIPYTNTEIDNISETLAKRNQVVKDEPKDDLIDRSVDQPEMNKVEYVDLGRDQVDKH